MSNTTPKVSVLTVTYNHERYIEQTVRSALMQQTDFEYEIVIGEDCSTDGTRNVLRQLTAEYPDRLRVLFRERNLGANLNFRDTYAACRGEYIALLEGDDYWTDSNKLRRQVEALDTRPDWSACFHPVLCIDSNGTSLAWVHPQNAPAEVSVSDLLERNLIQTCSVVLRRERVPAIPDCFSDLKIGDWPLWVLAAHTGPIGFLPQPMACYRLHPGGIWSNRDVVYRLKAILTMFETVDRHLLGVYSERIRTSRDRLIEEAFRQQCSLERDLKKSILEYRSSISYRLGLIITMPFRFVLKLFGYRFGYG